MTTACANGPTFGMVMQQSTLSLQEGRVGEDATNLIDFVVDFFRGLEELLATVDVEHEGHDVLWQVFGYFVELGRSVSDCRRRDSGYLPLRPNLTDPQVPAMLPNSMDID